MASRLVGAKPFPETMLGYCKLDPLGTNQWNFILKSYIFIQNAVRIMASILYRPQGVDHYQKPTQSTRWRLRCNPWYMRTFVMLCFTILWLHYNALSIYGGHISLNSSRKHLMGEIYMSFVNATYGRSYISVTVVLCISSYYRWLRCIESV